MSIKTLISFVITIIFIPQIFAQADTLFWFAAPEVSQDGPSNFDRPIAFKITTFSNDANVTISQPANPQFNINITMPANSTRTIDLTNWIDLIENKPANTILNYGLKIISTSKVTVYYEVDDWLNPEIFVLKGQNALGKNFLIPSQNTQNNGSAFTPTPKFAFDIVATEDNTVVTITPKRPLIGRPVNVPFSITLNKGQTYSATATTVSAADHLGGSKVISTKPIAITIKDDLLNGLPLYGTCSDLSGDQIVPIDLLGKEYIAINGFLDGPKDLLFIMATEDQTKVFKDGTEIITLNTTNTHAVPVGGLSTYIRSDKPIYVLQLSGFGCEFGMDQLPPITCTGSNEIAFSRSVSEPLFISILTRKGTENAFEINGNQNIIKASDFANVPATNGEWVFGKFPLPENMFQAGNSIRVKNLKNALFHMSLINGGATTGTRFGYFSNFNKINTKAKITPGVACDGETVQLEADSIFGARYSWYGPNGFISDLRTPSLPDVQQINGGNYYVDASFAGCISSPDSVLLSIKEKMYSSISQTICEGNSYLGYTLSGIYKDTLTAINGCDSIRTLTLTVLPTIRSSLSQTICQGETFLGYDKTGIYIDTLVTANGCDSLRILNLSVLPPKRTTISQTICNGESFEGYSAQGTYIDTLNSFSGCDSIRTLQLTVIPKYEFTIKDTICNGQDFLGYSTTGIYRDTLISTTGCDSIRIINLTVLESCEIFFPNAFTPNGDGINDIFKILNAFNISNYYLGIYNRYGQLVFSSNEVEKGWDGSFKNKKQPIGAYIWHSRFRQDGEQKHLKGTVILLR